MSAPIRISETDAEPISIVEARAHVGLAADERHQDGRLYALIAAVRAECEGVTQRTIKRATLELTLDGFPEGGEIVLLQPPVAEVTSILYADPSAAPQSPLQALPEAGWQVDLSFRDPARLRPAFGQRWPATLRQLGAVRIRYEAGWAKPNQVPGPIKLWMLIRLDQYFAGCEHESTAAMHRHTLLQPWMVYSR